MAFESRIILASNLENQIIRGKVSDFAVDSACLVGSRVADRLRLQLGDRVMVGQERKADNSA